MARALATSPKLLMLDEVMAGLTSTEVKASVDVIQRLREGGITIAPNTASASKPGRRIHPLTEPILKVLDLYAGYDGIPVIHGISLEVMPGELVAIVGTNGAGKTTTMRTISGLARPMKGEIFFEGKDISRLAANKILKLGISYVPEDRRLFAKLSVEQNLALGAYTEVFTGGNTQEAEGTPGNIPCSQSPGKTYSGNVKWWRTANARHCSGPYVETEAPLAR